MARTLFIFGLFVLSFAMGRWIGMPTATDQAATTAASTAAEAATKSDSALKLRANWPQRTLQPKGGPVRLSDALAETDPLVRAGQALEWIEKATLQDFQKLAEDPGSFPAGDGNPGFQRDWQRAFQHAFFERWFELDEKGAMAGAVRLDANLREANRTFTGELLAAAARVRPKLILDYYLSRNNGEWTSSVIEAAFDTLAETDTAAARAFALRIPEGEPRRWAEVAIERRLAIIDPLAGVAAAKRSRHSSVYQAALDEAKARGPGLLQAVIAAVGRGYDTDPYVAWLVLKDPEAAAELSGLEEVSLSDAGTLILSEQSTPEDRERFITNYAKLPENMRADAGAAMASAWARTQPEQAAAWALSNARPEDRAHPENRAVSQVFLRWVNNSPEQALAWWRALPDSPLRVDLGASASTYLAEGGDLDLALEMIGPGVSHAEPDLIGQMGHMLARRSPEEAGEWLASLPATAKTSVAAKLVVQAMYAKQPEAAAAYVESLPPGERRDQVVGAFVAQAALRNPADAAEWVTLVEDPKLRERAAMDVYRQWRDRSPAAAQAWMRTVNGVDPKWHARFLRTMR